jgi:two-component system response regulator PilR (NtrC family)
MATLLVIDDDTLIRETLYELLSESYECHTADRAEQALEYLEVEDYDVVLTDMSMPGLGGAEILKRIQQHHPTTPVIVISGTVREHEEALIKTSAFAFFAKPFQLEEIEDAVVRAIAHHRQLVEAEQKNPSATPPLGHSIDTSE